VSGILAAIEARLAPLAPESLELADESGQHIGHEGAKGGGGHYRLVIVSPAFRGRPLVARHRMVYDALFPLMQREIHALAIQAFAPEEL
jgi:BolA family transcriptional regulator, general stress-responsive regulator